jgi:uncharacterized protein (TIGR00251 family)
MLTWRVFSEFSLRRQEMTPLALQIRVKPRSRVSSLEQQDDGTWVARLKAPPVDGKANDELVALVAEHFGCRKADVSIKAGAAGRTKLVCVEAE